ncbi:hypothetical protein C8Q77DRAFT_564678 [Trametes polyzona]|nr:hypothetical protein C8Q77DRAFT_564678 [Trametes polyzona]
MRTKTGKYPTEAELPCRSAQSGVGGLQRPIPTRSGSQTSVNPKSPRSYSSLGTSCATIYQRITYGTQSDRSSWQCSMQSARVRPSEPLGRSVHHSSGHYEAFLRAGRESGRRKRTHPASRALSRCPASRPYSRPRILVRTSPRTDSQPLSRRYTRREPSSW